MQVRKTTYNDTQFTDQNAIGRALVQSPEKITPALIHLSGKEEATFPLTFMSEGMGNTKEIKSNQYEYDVMVRKRKTRPLLNNGVVSAGATGKGFAQFRLTFPDQWFIKDSVLTFESGSQARIMEEPFAGDGGYVYTMQLVGNNPAEVIPDSDLQAGKLVASLFAPVGQSWSRGNRSNWQAPATVRHKLTTIRKSYQMDGNAENYVADFQFSVKGGKKTNMWMQWEEYQHMLSWLEEVESFLWYGKQNYDESGNTTMYDENGQPVIIGPGLLEQVQNKDTFSYLTEQKLKQVIGDVFYGMTDGKNRNLTLFTGTGGMRDFDSAMKDYVNNNEYAKYNDGVFVNDNGNSLKLGNYFTEYRHVDGHSVTMAYLPLYDHGGKAQAAAKHPITGFSLESHRMTFIDQTQYDGENNLQMVYRNGRQMKRWATSGSIVPNGFQGQTSYLRASDIDGASVHFLKEGSVVIKRPTTSIDLQCSAS